MEVTWIAVLASLLMAGAAVCVFIFAVKKDYFRNIEDAKYQVFWSDLEEEPAPLRANRGGTGRASRDEKERTGEPS